MMKTTDFKIKHLKSSNKVSDVGYLSKDLFTYWLRILIWSLDLPKAPYFKLGHRIMSLWTINGSTFMVKYCKECTRILQAYVSGNPIFISNEFVVGIKGGIPSIIPGTLCSSLRSRDPKTIRGVLSLLSVYRIIKIPGNLKWNTITDPFRGLSSVLPQYEIRRATSELNFRIFKLNPIRLLLLSTAGPNDPTSMLGIWKDILAWHERPTLLNALKGYLERVPGGPEFLSLIEQEKDYLDKHPLEELKSLDSKPLTLGRLSLKMEPAGKIRIFAIVDALTQSVFKPLSDGIFEILRSLPMDGTFDQDGPVRHLVARLKNRATKEKIYSYDLSSATDRLPIDVQKQVLSLLMGEYLSDCWAFLLTERQWTHSSKIGGTLSLKYAVGQPMGALSSWAMLALTHHTIVRIAAIREGIHNFADYALLGDDIVIANEKVATQYHYLMTQVLGVDINLSKSLVSYDSFEFAKRLITLDGEVSPVGAKNLLVSVKSLKGIPSVYLDLVAKGLSLSTDYLVDHLKRFPSKRKTHLEKILWLIQGPFGFVPTTAGLSASVKLNSSLTVVHFYRLISTIEEVMYKSHLSVWERNMRKIDEIISSLLRWQDNSSIIKVQSGGTEVVERQLGSSPMFQHILGMYYEKWSELLKSKPESSLMQKFQRQVKLDHRDPDFNAKIHVFVKHLLRDDPRETVAPFDPFDETEKVILPLSHSTKVENFWLEVEKSSKRRFTFGGLPFV